jgi:hypothetical protein
MSPKLQQVQSGECSNVETAVKGIRTNVTEIEGACRHLEGCQNGKGNVCLTGAVPQPIWGLPAKIMGV